MTGLPRRTLRIHPGGMGAAGVTGVAAGGMKAADAVGEAYRQIDKIFTEYRIKA